MPVCGLCVWSQVPAWRTAPRGWWTRFKSRPRLKRPEETASSLASPVSPVHLISPLYRALFRKAYKHAPPVPVSRPSLTHSLPLSGLKAERMACFAALQLIARNAPAPPPYQCPPPLPMSCLTYLGVGRVVCTKPATFCPLPMLLTKPCVYLNVCHMTCLQNVPSRVLIQERERERER